MNFLGNLQLVATTAGTLLSLFLMILIVGYRRRRTFERVLFFLALALFLYYSGILLAENALRYYAKSFPNPTNLLIRGLVSIALIAIPGLLVHTHFAYGWGQERLRRRWWQFVLITAAYVPGIYFGLADLHVFANSHLYAFPISENDGNLRVYLFWLLAALVSSTATQLTFSNRGSTPGQRALHGFLAVYFAVFGLFAVNMLRINTDVLYGWSGGHHHPAFSDYVTVVGLTVGWVLPLAALVYAIVRYRGAWNWLAKEFGLFGFDRVSGGTLFERGEAR